jgi:hypothetical protein
LTLNPDPRPLTKRLNVSESDLSDGDFIVLELSADQLQLAQQVGHLSHSPILLSERILLTMTTIVDTTTVDTQEISVGDPEPDPYVFGLPRSGSGSISTLSSSKNSKKNLDSYWFVTSLRLLILGKLCSFKK